MATELILAKIGSAVGSLVISAVKKKVEYHTEPFAVRRRIKRRLDDAVDKISESLGEFLEVEHVSEQNIAILLLEAKAAIKPLLKKPDAFFAGSLTGRKIFDQLYPKKESLPQSVTDERLESVYAMLFSQIAEFVCLYPPAVEAWKVEKYRDDYRRHDELASSLQSLFGKVEALSRYAEREADTVFGRALKSIIRQSQLDLDLAAFRAEIPTSGKFNDLFIVPEMHIVQPDSPPKRTPIDRTDIDCQDGRTILAGAPGSGKTSLCLWLQREAVNRATPRLGIIIPLRSIDPSKLPSIQTLIRAAVGVHSAEDITPDRVRSWLAESRILILADGFDEVSPTHRDNVLTWLEELAALDNRSPIVLTSRPLSTEHLTSLPSTWNRVEVQPFDRPRVIDYIGRWYRYSPFLREDQRDIDAFKLAQQWHNDSSIAPLTGNPLMLTTLLLVHLLDGQLPHGRSRLYHRYLDGMLGIWDQRRKITSNLPGLTAEHKRRFLTRLAVFLLFAEQDQLDEKPMLDLVAVGATEMGLEYSPELILAELRERTGLLIGPGTYSFLHKTVGEYLVAEAILERNLREPAGRVLDRLKLFEERHNDRWNSTLFFWAGAAPVIDLIEFIDQALEMRQQKDAGLVLGLLYDQLYRIDPGVMRPPLLKLLQLPVSTDSHQKMNYVVGANPANEDVQIETVEVGVRGLTPLNEWRVTRSLIQKLSLRWKDLASADPTWLPRWWTAKIKYPFDAQDWIDLLAGPRPTVQGGWWQLFALGYGMDETESATTPLSTEDRVRLFCEQYPESVGMVAIGLLGETWAELRRFVFFIQMKAAGFEDYVNRDPLQEITLMLKLTVKFGDLPIDDSWLRKTSDYVSFHGESGPEDLLVSASLDVTRAQNDGLALDPKVVESFRALLARLLKKRQALTS